MFTGLIETTGILRDIRRVEKSILLGIAPEMTPFEVAIGASVAVNGACLTLESVCGNRLLFTAVAETVDRTILHDARIGDVVNLERALRATDRLDGHMVLGHVDGVGVIVGDRTDGVGVVRSVEIPENLMTLTAEKGSIALDGISLTIARIDGNVIEISFIPHTLKKTTMGRKIAGEKVNIECDVLARYVARMMNRPPHSGPTPGSLAKLSSGSLLDALERSGF
jgi:riboflavin synthase alpha subunit